jgi:hypothetical protein
MRIESKGGYDYWNWGTADFDKAFDVLSTTTSGHRLQEYFQLTSIPTYEQLESLGNLVDSRVEYGLLVKTDTAYLIQGLEKSVGGGLASDDGVIFLHTHPNNTPPSLGDLAISGRKLHSAHAVINKEGIYSYTGPFILEPSPKSFESEDAKVDYVLGRNHLALEQARQESDQAFWEEYIKAFKNAGANINMYSWGQDAEAFWSRIIENYEAYLAHCGISIP